MATKPNMPGGGKKKLRSARNKANGKYVRQQRRTEINRRNRHKNHIRVHPNDLQTLKLLHPQ